VRARSTAVLLCAAVGLLGAYMLVRAVDLASTGKPTGIALALGVILLVAVGALLVAGEVRFGLGSERLGRRLSAEGGLADTSALERTPSGRVSRDAADALFTERKAGLARLVPARDGVRRCARHPAWPARDAYRDPPGAGLRWALRLRPVRSALRLRPAGVRRAHSPRMRDSPSPAGTCLLRCRPSRSPHARHVGPRRHGKDRYPEAGRSTRLADAIGAASRRYLAHHW